jgi:hypothetical protein
MTRQLRSLGLLAVLVAAALVGAGSALPWTTMSPSYCSFSFATSSLRSPFKTLELFPDQFRTSSRRGRSCPTRPDLP